ncbi:MAG: phosphosulfolactate synthase [Burkholderiales bacterium]|nr:phosphosulfolactate synthase [Burkholderiales bacterium]
MGPQKSPGPAFELPPRGAKPRRRGITSMIDFGPDESGWTGGERGISDLLEVAAGYIDYAKIYAMNALLIPAATVARTTRLYLDAGVMPFAGGILFEYAWQRNEVDGMIAHLKRLAVPALELSENYISLSDDERRHWIDHLQRAGLRVMYEFGRKNPAQPMSIAELGAVVADVARQGIDHVTVEQSEIDMLAAKNPAALGELARETWFENVLIEVDPYRFPEQHVQMIRDFGPEVSLANVAPGQVLRLEGFRRGIGRAVNYTIVSAPAKPA